MSFNEEELIKIKNKTSGLFKGKARRTIADTIREYAPQIEAAKSLSGDERKKALLKLLDRATSQRHVALQRGANSYSHPTWAAASVVESWLHELLGGDQQGIQKVEALIHELRDRA